MEKLSEAGGEGGRLSGANTQMTKCFLLSRENDFPLRMNNGIFAVQIFIFLGGINMHFMGCWSQAKCICSSFLFCKNAIQTCTTDRETYSKI